MDREIDPCEFERDVDFSRARQYPGFSETSDVAILGAGEGRVERIRKRPGYEN
jgi:hypothetical protein